MVNSLIVGVSLLGAAFVLAQHEATKSPVQTTWTFCQRFLFELRTRDGQWWLDAFVTGGASNDYRSLLLLEDHKHPVGRWYAVTQTYDDKTHRSYVNGVLQGELPLSAYKPMGPGGAAIGARANKSDYFKGAVRQARFTSSALSPDQFLRVPAQQ